MCLRSRGWSSLLKISPDSFLRPSGASPKLSLPNNHLIRRLPPQIVDCSKIEIVDLPNNQFSGYLSLIHLRVLNLSLNRYFFWKFWFSEGKKKFGSNRTGPYPIMKHFKLDLSILHGCITKISILNFFRKIIISQLLKNLNFSLIIIKINFYFYNTPLCPLLPPSPPPTPYYHHPNPPLPLSSHHHHHFYSNHLYH